MNCREHHYALTGPYSVCTVSLTVEGLKGHAFHVYRTADGPFSKRIAEGWCAGSVREAKQEARFALEHDATRRFPMKQLDFSFPKHVPKPHVPSSIRCGQTRETLFCEPAIVQCTKPKNHKGCHLYETKYLGGSR
jgi:hypothetical protein